MAANASSDTDLAGAIGDFLKTQTEVTRAMLGPLAPPGLDAVTDPEQAVHWTGVVQRLQSMWFEYQAEQAGRFSPSTKGLGDIAQLAGIMQGWAQHMPFADRERQRRLFEGGLDIYERVLATFGMGPSVAKAPGGAALPRSDPRFENPLWREQPFFALLHQTYLLLSEELNAMADEAEGLEPVEKDNLRFTTRAILDALSPANFPMTNPVAIDRARETRGASLIKGMEHLLADLRRGQMTHTSPTHFKLGENIAATPGKVVQETPLYQVIQYTPVTETVLTTPLVIFPAWINRFYILDLSPKKSFVRWAVEQGISVFIVSWKSADETMAEVTWDDYVLAEVAVVDFVRARLKVPSAHVIGYCVAGTTLAATLAMLARQGDADRIASATFFTAQVDFEEAGELRNFTGGQTLETIAQISPEGYLDGRYMAAAFNMLRGNDLIWSYVSKNYLLGEDYQAFDLLHWNGDVTNLPSKWHASYLRDLYRDNRLSTPDALSICGVPIDIGQVRTPCFIQAGREDHIAPPQSVWKLTRQLKGPWAFLLAGSGHIAGVVNSPITNKYSYWTNEEPAETLDAFIAGATEHPGSWWPHWLAWVLELDDSRVPARGKRKPGGRGDRVIEDAPGRYVGMR